MTVSATCAISAAPSIPVVTDSYEYDAYGNEFTVTGSTPNEMMYRGEQYGSDLGLYNLRARYYHPLTGRFMSRDPEDGNPIDPKTLHKYLYAGGEAVGIEVGQSLKGDDVVRTLNCIKLNRGVPKVLFCDNGSEFTSQAMDLWAYRHGVKIDFSRPGKPTDNAFVESFNGTFRAECLDTHWFCDLKEARQLIQARKQEYNESRPHASLGDRTPSEFASQIAASRDLAGT